MMATAEPRDSRPPRTTMTDESDEPGESPGLLLVMFPTHVAIGYLAGFYSRYPVAAFSVGSVLPDLFDRPLFWLGVAPHSHTVGHSLFVAVPVSVVLIHRFGLPGVAVGVGWFVHAAMDVLNVLTTDGPARAPYFVLYPLSIPEGSPSFAAVTFTIPGIGLTHTVNPALLVVEAVVVCWMLAVVARERGLSGRVGEWFG